MKKVWIFLVVAFVMLAAAVPVMDVSNMDGLHLQGSFGTATPILRADQQGTGKILELLDNGTPVFSVNNGGAAVGLVLQYGSSGKKLVCGSQTITGTGTVSHGLATPEAVICGMGANVTGDGSTCSSTNSAAVVTLKVWNSAATPAAATTPIAVDYCIVGTP